MTGDEFSRQEAGLEGNGGDERCTATRARAGSGRPSTEVEQATGALLAHLEAIRASVITGPEKRAVPDSIDADEAHVLIARAISQTRGRDGRFILSLDQVTNGAHLEMADAVVDRLFGASE